MCVCVCVCVCVRARAPEKGHLLLIETDACRLVAGPCSAADRAVSGEISSRQWKTLRPGGFIRDNLPPTHTHISTHWQPFTLTPRTHMHTHTADTRYSRLIPQLQIMTPSYESHQVQKGCILLCVCVRALSFPVRCSRAILATTMQTTDQHSQVSSPSIQQALCLFSGIAAQSVVMAAAAHAKHSCHALCGLHLPVSVFTVSLHYVQFSWPDPCERHHFVKFFWKHFYSLYCKELSRKTSKRLLLH